MFICLTSAIDHDHPLRVFVRPEAIDILFEQRHGTMLFTMNDGGALVKETPEEIIEKMKDATNELHC